MASERHSWSGHGAISVWRNKQLLIDCFTWRAFGATGLQGGLYNQVSKLLVIWYSMFFGSLYSKLSHGNKYFKSQHLIGLKLECSRHSCGKMTEIPGAENGQGSASRPKHLEEAYIPDYTLKSIAQFETQHPNLRLWIIWAYSPKDEVILKHRCN